jgi:predicted nucleic acid-binding protein
VEVRLLIASNRYTDFARGDPDVVARFEAADELWMSLIVLGEMRGGFALGTRSRKNEKLLEKFLKRPDVQVLVLGQEAARIYGDIWATLKKRGTPIPTNDIWIAAQAIQHDLTLDTRDSHFQHVPGLKLVAVKP